MRILIFTENYYIGGTDSVIVNLMNNWPARDEFLVVCNYDHPGLKVIEERVRVPCRIIRHHAWTREQFAKRCGNGFFARLCLRIVFSAGQYLFLLYHVLYFRRLLARLHPDKVLIIAGNYPGGSTARAVALQGLFRKRARKPLFAYLNDPAGVRFVYALPEYAIDTLVNRSVTYLVTLSYATQNNLSRRPALTRSSKKKVIYNSIEIPSRETTAVSGLRDELKIGKDTPLLLLLANYEPRKGHEFLFKTLRLVLEKFPDVHLVCAGFSYPVDRNRVEALVAQYELSSAVHLLGFRNDVDVMLRDATLLVLSSQCCEGLPTVIVEAMARKVPVVATNIGGTGEVLIDGKGGFALPLNLQLFADKIIELLGDAELRACVGVEGYQVVTKRFDARNMARAYYDLLYGKE